MTCSILYLSLYLHKANRNVQHTLLSQQTNLLNSVVEPLPPLPESPAYEVRNAGFVEQLKDRWNREVVNVVRNFEDTDWSRGREFAEEKIANVWSRLRQTEKAQQLEERFQENVGNTETGQTTPEPEEPKTSSTRLLELK